MNAAADYSRYLPRHSSGRGVAVWTAFGVLLALAIGFLGTLLAARERVRAQKGLPVGGP